jgi:aminoglycoside phosphotransferase (APT) family kinase protein
MLDPRALLLRTWPLRGGISSRMTVLEFAVGDERRRVVLRQPDGALQQDPLAVANESRLLRLLTEAGLPSPALCLVDESVEIFGAPFLVIEYLDGVPDFAKSIGADSIEQLAAQLVRIHRTPFAGTGLESLLPEYAPRFVHQRDRVYPDASLRAADIREVLQRTWPPESRNRRALLHGDYWPGNVLWRGARLVGVVDWEEACIGDPIADVATARLELLWAFGAEAMHAFTQRYAMLSGLDLTDLPFWDLDAALRPVFNLGEWAAGWPDLGRPDVTEATMRAGHRTFVDLAFAALSRKQG